MYPGLADILYIHTYIRAKTHIYIYINTYLYIHITYTFINIYMLVMGQLIGIVSEYQRF